MSQDNCFFFKNFCKGSKKGNEKSAIPILKARVAAIYSVIVVSKLTPKTTPKALLKESIPASKNTRTKSVTIELLCKIAITNVPVTPPPSNSCL